jgi:hypothetical protein
MRKEPQVMHQSPQLLGIFLPAVFRLMLINDYVAVLRDILDPEFKVLTAERMQHANASYL